MMTDFSPTGEAGGRCFLGRAADRWDRGQKEFTTANHMTAETGRGRAF